MQRPEDGQEKTHQEPFKVRKPYVKPAILHELETRAGSPLGLPDPMDPFGLDRER